MLVIGLHNCSLGYLCTDFQATVLHFNLTRPSFGSFKALVWLLFWLMQILYRPSALLLNIYIQNGKITKSC